MWLEREFVRTLLSSIEVKNGGIILLLPQLPSWREQGQIYVIM